MRDWGRRRVTLLGVVVAASTVDGSGAHATPYDFTTINVPGSYYTTAYGINNAGTVVGSYNDASGAPDHGFLYSGGNFATIDVPGAYATQVLGINNAGQIVGSYEDSRSHPGVGDGTYTGSTTGIYSATTYDSGRAYAAQQMASAQTVANFAAIQLNGQQALDQLQNAILKDNTVLPGQWIGGVVVLDSPTETNGAASYSLDVRIGGEIHTFAINDARV